MDGFEEPSCGRLQFLFLVWCPGRLYVRHIKGVFLFCLGGFYAAYQSTWCRGVG